MKMKFIVLVVFILQGIFVHGESESQSDNRQTTIIVKPGS